MDFKYDVIVIGAGHAGCEAAAAAANLGSKTCLITMDMNKIGQMSCNPAVGGIAKGQIVREIDALGGQMGLVTDETAIQFRILNKERLGVIRTFIIQMHGITDRSSLFTSISSEEPPIFLLTKRQQIKD